MALRLILEEANAKSAKGALTKVDLILLTTYKFLLDSDAQSVISTLESSIDDGTASRMTRKLEARGDDTKAQKKKDEDDVAASKALEFFQKKRKTKG